jgi:uracil-DNA glycosylase family 4
MLSDRQIKLLTRLDKQIQSCKQCGLFVNGRAKPYWTPASKYGIFVEAPGKEEVIQNTPLCGTTGVKFWSLMQEYKYHRAEFFVINSVNCRPVDNGKNGKPTLEEMGICSAWVRKYIRVIQPSKMLVMGKYAIGSMNTLLGEEVFYTNSMIKDTGNKKFIESFYGVPMEIVTAVHPSFALVYNPTEGLAKLKESIEVFDGS